RKRRVDHRSFTRIQYDAGAALYLESFFLDGYNVGAKRQVRYDEVSIVASLDSARVSRVRVRGFDASSRNGGAGRVGNASPHTSVDCFGLGECRDGENQKRYCHRKLLKAHERSPLQ